MDSPLYIDVSLPVPVDQPFTYALPDTLRHRVRAGCRVLAPFGVRKLTGIILRCHSDEPSGPLREALRLLDPEPVLGDDMLALGRWIASYYCAPLGEVLRMMTPLSGEVRRTKVYTLTDAGRDVLRQLVLDTSAEDDALSLMRLLEPRSLPAAYLTKKLPDAAAVLRSLQKKGFVRLEDEQKDRDPLRASSVRLRVELLARDGEIKLPKAERELLAYLELHPGSHNLKDVEEAVKNASTAARALARKNLVALRPEPLVIDLPPARPVHVLNTHQQKCFDEIRAAIQAAQFQPFLLRGVTGSGKTEVYLRSIDEALALGRGALLLVPEIALTPAMAGQFFHRFGDRVAILHSAFTDTERSEQWRRIRSGAASVVVGTRSAVFAPVANLGLVVVDEEQDYSYKQDETPRYNGRDVAIVRAKNAGACVILGSATPSLESRYNADHGKYKLLELPERIEQRPLADIELIDMRVEFLETRQQATFSRRLLAAIHERLENGEQTMLLLNRRGFSSFVACRKCGERVQCVNCSVTLTYHRRERCLLCHYCNYATKVPSVCPSCQSEHLYFMGIGSERVEDELHQQFPKARIARMDRDTVSGRRHFETILAGFRDRDTDILVGTQMIAKGHDIHNVTLVGVVSADIGLGMPDFRSGERTFQLLTQVAGRAGRGHLPGIVLIQTINPDHYAIRFAAQQNYAGFYAKELHFRRAMRYPPFSSMASVMTRHEKQEEAMRMSAELSHWLGTPPPEIKILGPAEAPVVRVMKEYRYQFLFKSSSRKVLNDLLHRARQFGLDQKWGPTALVIDVDPLRLT
jgi:primosomal protein N' (replication factor Y)